MSTVTTQQNLVCPACGSKDIIKKGERRNRLQIFRHFQQFAEIAGTESAAMTFMTVRHSGSTMVASRSAEKFYSLDQINQR